MKRFPDPDPCPYCGDTPYLTTRSDERRVYWTVTHTVRCPYNQRIDQPSRADAIAAWERLTTGADQ